MPFVPQELTSQSWQVVSFLEDAELRGINVFNLDFERKAGTSQLAKVWLATSDGLREYDGYQWHRHGRENGLPSDFVRCVLLSRSGDLWVGTDRGAGVYSGQSYRSYGSETNLAGMSVRRMVEDPDGTIWFCSDPWPNASESGGLTSFRDGHWTNYRRQDGLPSDYVVNCFRDSVGQEWVVTKDGLARRQGSGWVISLSPTPEMDSFASGSLAELSEGGLLFSTGYELFKRVQGSWERLGPMEDHRFGICRTHDGKLVASCPSGAGLRCFVEWTTNGWKTVSASFDQPHAYGEDIREDPEGNVWMVGFETVRLWRRHSQWREYRGLPTPRLVDGDGHVWFLDRPRWSVRGRLAIPAPQPPIRYVDDNWERLDGPYQDLVLDAKGKVWGWNSNWLSRWDGTNEIRLGEQATGLRQIQIGRPMANGGFWMVGLDAESAPAISFSESGSNRWSVRQAPELRGTIRDNNVTSDRDGAWLVMRYQNSSNCFAVHLTRTLAETVEIPSAYMSAFRSGLFASPARNELFLYGDNGLYRKGAGAATWEAITNLPGRAVYALAEQGTDLWLTCSGMLGGESGLARLREGRWTFVPSWTSFQLGVGSDGALLWGSLGKVQSLSGSTAMDPVGLALPDLVLAEQPLRDQQGRIWVGSERQVFQFAPDRHPPRTYVLTQGTNFIRGQDVIIKAGAIGRFSSSREQNDHMFSWRLDDGTWGSFSNGSTYVLSGAQLGASSHYIEVRARDSGGDVDPIPARFSFQVHSLPIQDRPWFLWAVLGSVSLLSLLSLIAVHARRQAASHARNLEQRVVERTAELEFQLKHRQQAEEALRVSEQRLRTTMNNLLEGCQIVGFDWRYLYVNRVAALHGRRTTSELIGMTMSEVYPGIEQTELYGALRTCMRDRVVVSLENQFSFPNGELAIFELEIQPVPEGISIHSIDVTARRRAEEAREQLASLVRYSGDFIGIADLKGEVTYLNPAGRRMIGFGETEPIDRLHFSDYVPDAWKQFFAETVVPSAKEKGLWEGEMQLRNRLTGELIDVSRSTFLVRNPGSSDPLCIGTVTRDITSRKRMERQLRDSDERFRQLAGNIREVFWLTDVAKNQMLYISPGYERIWGRSCEDLYASPASWLEAIHADDRNRVLDAAMTSQASGEYDLEYRIVRPDGTERWIHDRAFPVRNSEGQVFRVAGIAEDVTERRQLEAQIRQAQKMEALGTLSGGIAHDFNNILGAIFGNIHLAQMDVPSDSPALQSLDEIERAADRAKNLVRQILAFGRHQSQARQVTSLVPILKEAASLLRATLPAGVELVKTIGSQVPNVLADPSQMHQVLLNLCTNSWHALDGESGRIEIRLSEFVLRKGQSPPVAGLHPGRYACLAVSDDGCGMDASTMDRIFEPFFTTKQPGRGTGLGLSVVHGIVQSHDGVVRVQSQLGEGTTFELYFPAIDAESEMVSSRPQTLVKGNGQRVMYVDDEASLVALNTRMLRHLGYVPEGFTQPFASLEAFRAQPDKYALIITDLHMPGLSGLEFARSVRKVRPDIPIVLSSGHLTEEVVARARSLGIKQLLHKPNTLEEFSTCIHDFLHPQQP